MRVVFFGAGDIGLPSLDALIASADPQLIAVVTQPDKPVGRGRQIISSRVKTRALASGIPVLQPERVRDAARQLQDLRAEIFVVVAYGQILPRDVLDLPSQACLNIHASLLPRHRGASPIQAAIREGDAQTGITIMWMDEGLDTGDMLLSEPVAIAPDDTGGSLHDRLAELAPDCLMRALRMVATGNAPRIPQDPGRATITKKLERRHGHIEWSGSAEEVSRLVRAYDPWPGTFCLMPAGAGKEPVQLKVHRIEVAGGDFGSPAAGTVVVADDRLLVACGQGVVSLLEVQAEGRKRMSAADYLRGQSLSAGTRLQ